MSKDLTEQQSLGQQSTSQRLSLQATTPPAAVPGYRLQRFLGAGAFGQVWVGRDLNTGRSVAVKFYLHRGGVNWSLLSREVKNLVQLSADRHVVQVLEVGWDADPPYYVMELIGGGSLEELLQARGRLPVSEAVTLFRKICLGLNHCHGKGVLHCDLKPANILLGEDNEPRLADFGQSRMSHEQTPALGTLFYMAPEQADLTSTPDAGWDVYAAGAILYRMLTGSPPYRDDSLVSEIDTAGSLPKRLQRYRQAIVESAPPNEHLERRGVDRLLARIVSRSLAVHPAERYANVQQILQDLDRRDQVRTRRPLIMLGIVGPLMLLAALCIFALRSIEHASASTMAALRTEAFGSNQLAARFAARTLESEIDRYFQLAREEAASDDLRAQLRSTLQSPQVKPLLDQIAAADSREQSVAVRERLLDQEARLQLDEFLQRRLSQYQGPSTSPRRPQLATMFITDARGTIVGIAYDEPVERDQNSAGKNFAYRSYFHGGRQELPADTPSHTIQPLTKTRLTSAFQSTATGLWKVAVSTPIRLSEDSTTTDAVFVATINLGDFQLLQSERGANQVAVLIDARTGPLRGTVLQHPLMDSRQDQGRTLAGERFQVPPDLMDRLLEGGDVDYRDPMAQADDGGDYAGPWIAAMQPIELPEGTPLAPPQEQSRESATPGAEIASAEDSDHADEATTDMMVLVQYRLAKVFAPVGQMRSLLVWEGAAAVGSILLVMFTLWYLVWRSSTSRPDHDASDIPHTGATETIAVS